MLIDHAGGGGLTSATSTPVSPSLSLPSVTSAKNALHERYTQSSGRAKLPGATGIITHYDKSSDVEDEKKAPSFDEFLDSIFSKFMSTTDLANQVARENATNAQNFEAEQARIAYERAKELEDTYYQRRVRDLEAAGLNKWMAVYGNMSGSTSVNPSTPSGHVADTFKKEDIYNVSDTISMAPMVLKLIEAYWNQSVSALKGLVHDWFGIDL